MQSNDKGLILGEDGFIVEKRHAGPAPGTRAPDLFELASGGTPPRQGRLHPDEGERRSHLAIARALNAARMP